jgi:cytochrome c oxidase assembly protein subunit 15
MVTSTGSGLSVPDWPLSYGELFPPMVGGIFYEHGHRMVAGTVGILMLILAIWTWRSEPRRWVRNLAFIALAAVVVQAVLGGITVLYLLPTPVSVSHAGLANLFFCLTVALALVTGRRWFDTPVPAEPGPRREVRGLRNLAIATTVVIYVQILLGALMRHTQAGLAIPDFPLSLGRVIPPLDDPKVAAHFAHRAWAVMVLVMAVVTVVRVLRRHGHHADLLRPALVVAALVVAQVLLGAFTVLTGKAPVLTTFHVAGGSALLAASLALTLRAGRRAGAAGATVPAVAAEGVA